MKVYTAKIKVEFPKSVFMDLTQLKHQVKKEDKEVDTKKKVHSVGFPGALIHKLKCPYFSGKYCENDKFAFKNFMAQFENYVINIDLKQVKLQLLKAYLTGHAAEIIQHLTIKYENYDV